MSFKLPHGIVPIHPAHNLYSRTLHNITRTRPNRRFIVRDQHDAGGLPVAFGNRLEPVSLHRNSPSGREKNTERGAASRLTFDPQSSLVPAHDSLDRGKPEPTAGKLGREKRVEN